MTQVTVDNSEPTANETPNVVVASPTIRRIANAALSSIGVILGTVIVVDLASPAFDLSQWTDPITAGFLYLSGVFGVAVTLPNIPRGK